MMATPIDIFAVVEVLKSISDQRCDVEFEAVELELHDSGVGG